MREPPWVVHGYRMHETVSPVNTLSPRQNGRRFAGDLFKYIFLNENVWILIKISLKFVPKDPINNIPALVRVMAWRRPGAKPLFEPVMVNDEWWLPTHIKRHSASMTIGPWEIRQYTKVLWRHQMETFPRYWAFVWGIHRSPVSSPHKGQWHGALMFSLICAWINGWVKTREAGNLRRHRAHYDVIVMVNATEPINDKSARTGSGNSNLPSGTKPLPEPMLTQISLTRHSSLDMPTVLMCFVLVWLY